MLTQMNKRGQGLALAITFAITFFIVGLGLFNILAPEVTIARGATSLNCINASNISDGTRLTCLAVDLTIPYFILLVISISGGLIIRRFKV